MTTSSNFVVRDMPRGIAGLKDGLAELAARVDRGRNHPKVIEWTRRVLQERGALEPRGRPDPSRIVHTLRKAIREKVGFVRDPVDTELMIAAQDLLCLDPSGRCVPAGDCDDQILVLAACVLSAGVPVQFRQRLYAGSTLAHVVMLFDRSTRLAGDWTCIDPSIDSGRCSDAPYEEEFTMEVHMGGDRGTFVGMGDPPDSMGDTPAQLSPEESRVWIEQAAIVRDTIARSAANLRAKRDALVKVRADFGLPAVDPPPSGENNTPSANPLADYGATLRWTQAAQDAENKLLSAADYVTSVLDDGLAGSRPMYWQDRDLLVGGRTSDPFFLLMVDGVPTYVDPKTNQPTGQMGALPLLVPILVVGAVVVVAALSLAAAWNMDKIIDYVAQRHHDEMLSDIAKSQQSMIESGKATPEQVRALTQANTDLANASKIEKPSFPWMWLIFTAALAAVGGAVAARSFTVTRKKAAA